MHRIDRTEGFRDRTRVGGWWGGIPPVIRILFLIDLAFPMIHLAVVLGQCSNSFIRIMFHLDHEFALPSWYSICQLMLVGALLATLATYIPRRIDKVRMGFAAALFFFLSKEELHGIHEAVMYHLAAQRTPEAAADSFFRHSTAWPLFLGPPLLAALLVLGWRARGILRGRPRVIRHCVAGTVLFVGGSAGVEVLVNFATLETTSHFVEVAVEEGMEMAGVTFFLWAAYGLLNSYGIRLAVGEPAGGAGGTTAGGRAPHDRRAVRPGASRGVASAPDSEG